MGLRQAYCLLFDSRDQATRERREDLSGVYGLLRCRTAMNGSEVCPKGWNPSHAIERVRSQRIKKEGDSSALPTHKGPPVR